MDLKQRGLLEDTIVWFSGEFGRTPYAQKNGTGRDHNADGFTTWLAIASSPASPTVPRTSLDIKRSRTKSTCMIYTPRCCTCWDSITNG